MEVNITIPDESRFSEIIKNELEAFTKEELHSIIANALTAYFSEEGRVKDLFYTETRDHWGTLKRERNEFFNALIPSCDETANEIFDAVKEKIKEVVTSDNFIQEAIKDVFFSNLTDKIVSNIASDGGLRYTISNIVKESLQPQQ